MQQDLTRTKCPKCHFSNPLSHVYCSKCRTLLPRISMDESPAPPTPDEPRRPQQVTLQSGQIVAGRYKVVSMIGKGGMGCIYRVYDNILHEEVALKTLLPEFAKDKMVLERFRNEARIARQLSHPNIVRVHDIGLADGVLYISMEYIKGQSLRGHIDAMPPGQRLPVKTTLRVMDELCAALEYAHQFTVHRDLKPENVMIAEDGAVRLMDFGISKLMSNPNMTATSMIMGTPHYMSPEQLRDSRAVDARADIYSLGVMLYEIVTGNLPTGIPKPASQLMRDVPPALDPIVVKCVEPDPNNRYQSVAELREALRPIRELVDTGTSIAAKPARPSAALPFSARKALGGLLLIATIALCAWGILAAENKRRESIAAAPAAEVNETPAQRSDFQRIEELAQLAKNLAAAVNDKTDAMSEIIELGDDHWRIAADFAATDEARAAQQGKLALECYFGVAASVRRPNARFIPPGKVVPAPSSDEVSISGFFIDALEVTNEQFYAFATTQPSPWRVPGSIRQGQDLPVADVTFYDALAYALANGKRLPTEAQWARAAYGGQTSAMFPWGEEWEDEAANVNAPQVGAAPVGAFEMDVNEWGVRDLAGNVSEWTCTLAGSSTHGDDSSELDFGSEITIRGGSFSFPPVPLTETSTGLYEQRGPNLGFRCVEPLPDSLDAIEEVLNTL